MRRNDDAMKYFCRYHRNNLFNPITHRRKGAHVLQALPLKPYEPADNSTTAYGKPWFNPQDRIYPRKYTNDGLGRAAETRESGINYRVLRYADILRMYAEVLDELNRTAAAYPFIQQVRTRANLPNLATVKPGMNQAQMRDQLGHERALEFAIEGQRINDITRWGWLYDPAKLAELKAARSRL